MRKENTRLLLLAVAVIQILRITLKSYGTRQGLTSFTSLFPGESSLSGIFVALRIPAAYSVLPDTVATKTRDLITRQQDYDD